MQKGDERFVPCGSTVIEAGDALPFLMTEGLAEAVRARLLDGEEPEDVPVAGA